MSAAVDVVIVSYNTRDLLCRCLETLLGEGPCAENLDLRVTVVDNASTDGSVEFVAAAFPGVGLVRNRANRGYAAALNQGLGMGAAPLVLLLNSDALLTPRSLGQLSDQLMDNPGLALLGPRVVTPDGRREETCGRFPGLLPGALRVVGLGMLGTYTSPRTTGEVRPVEWVSGVCWLARRAALEALGPAAPARDGPFDTGFAMYFEDVDLCWRLRQAGWRAGYTDRVGVVHLGSASWGGRWGRKRRARDASQIRYFLKRHQHAAASAARLRRALRLRFSAYYRDEG